MGIFNDYIDFEILLTDMESNLIDFEDLPDEEQKELYDLVADKEWQRIEREAEESELAKAGL